MVLFILPVLYFLLIIVLSMFEYISAQKIRNNTVEATFGVPCASTEPKKILRVNTIFERKIGFLLEFGR